MKWALLAGAVGWHRLVWPRQAFLVLLPRWIASWIAVELLPALRDPAGPALGLRHRDVSVERGRVYARVKRRRIRLDVYRARQAADEPRPAVVNIHGGAWVMGSRREQARPLLYHLASQGWVGFNVDYRLCPGASLGDQVEDITRAIAWIRRHAGELGVDPGRVVVTGGSAGGHLAALVALTATGDGTVQAAIPCYGVYDLEGELRSGRPRLARMVERHVVKGAELATLSPITHVHRDAPPFLVVHGTADSLVPVAEGRGFAARLREVSRAPVEYLELEGAEHAFDLILSRRTEQLFAAVDDFLTTEGS